MTDKDKLKFDCLRFGGHWLSWRFIKVIPKTPDIRLVFDKDEHEYATAEQAMARHEVQTRKENENHVHPNSEYRAHMDEAQTRTRNDTHNRRRTRRGKGEATR